MPQANRGKRYAIVILSLLMAGCGEWDESTVQWPRPRIVATVGMVADLVRELVADEADVVQLMGSGVDPHLYQATRDDVRSLMAADLIVAVGLHLEGRLQDTFERLEQSRTVVYVSQAVPVEQLLVEEGSAGVPDPHLWMDVALWASCLPELERALVQLLPEAEVRIADRRRKLELSLRALHEYGRESVATIPEERRVLITSHDAFRYFGRAYGLEVLGIQGISTDSEAGLHRMNELVDLLVERQISAVFVESSVPRRSIEALIEGAAARGAEVRVGGELFSDAMGPAGTVTGTYRGMLDHNLTTTVRALGGDVSATGHTGELQLEEGNHE